jgi:phosphoribosyl 1,2-cyclic phosphodiesterase
VQVTFYGVRGSTPCPNDDNQRYGGNTSCAVIEADDHDPIVLDLGTGLRTWGETFAVDSTFRGHALVTHVHWDHVQGLPFFAPVLRAGSTLQVYGPPPDTEGIRTLGDCFEQFICPPLFPVCIDDLPGKIEFHTIRDTDLVVGDAKVTVRDVPHTGLTNGYRIELEGVTVVYISDHQMPLDGSHAVTDDVLELCAGADLLIHDAQYTPEEFAARPDWGHCTVEFAVHVAAEAGARRLALFHHDPTHDDDFLDCLVQRARLMAGRRVEEVLGASEGLTIVL